MASVRPHIYFFAGQWWVSRTGHRGLGDASRPTFDQACYLAMLAAVNAGWSPGRRAA